MGRLIASVIVGYVAMAVLVFLLLCGAYVVLGTDRAFFPGSWNVSMLWSVLSIVLSFVAAIAGGITCAAIAKDAPAAKWLAVLVLVLGVALAVPTLSQPAGAEARPAVVPLIDAVQKGRQPSWVALLNPVIGVLGVLVGGRRRSGATA